MPIAFYEVEHSTDIQNSLLKYADLQDFHTRMFIVADEKRKPEYNKKLTYDAFIKLREDNRVEFMSYKQLLSIYQNELLKSEIGFTI